jgi:hypothetical protein
MTVIYCSSDSDRAKFIPEMVYFCYEWLKLPHTITTYVEDVTDTKTDNWRAVVNIVFERKNFYHVKLNMTQEENKSLSDYLNNIAHEMVHVWQHNQRDLLAYVDDTWRYNDEYYDFHPFNCPHEKEAIELSYKIFSDFLAHIPINKVKLLAKDHERYYPKSTQRNFEFAIPQSEAA